MQAMILLRLFWSFLKIGFTSFGGLSMIPLINSEMLGNGWMTADEVADIVAIAEMTPGPLGLNCASFAGMRTAGIAGSIAANLGVLAPTLTLGAAAAMAFERFKNSSAAANLLSGVRPSSTGMVLGLVISMCMSNYNVGGELSIPAVCLGLADVVLLLRFKLSIPLIIILNAALGTLIFGVFTAI